MAYGPRQMDKSKRQDRVGHLVQSELSQILRRGFPLVKSCGDDDGIAEELRRRISIVDVDMAPDLRQARITVSVMGHKDAIVEKRRAYSWMVTHTKSIRHALAKRMDHMKVLPNLTFVLADVAAAVDVMALIEKVSAGQDKRDDVVSEYDYYYSSDGGGMTEDDDDLDFGDDGENDDDWIEDDEDDDDWED